MGWKSRKSIAMEIYNVNIVDYKEKIDNVNNKVYHEFVFDYNSGQDYNKDLCIFTQINGNHFNILFDKNYKCFKDKNNKLLLLNLNNSLNKSYDKEKSNKNSIFYIDNKKLIKNNKSKKIEEKSFIN